jgi:hypothetical protein
MMETVLGLEPWLGYLIIAVILTYTLAAGGWVLAKAGRSPLWILLLLVPYLNVVAIWAFAYTRWPFVDGARDGRDDAPPTTD